ncbi:hypothetical protein [Streptomyces sp. SPB4]|uniref:hypothetical protein n=1 Tax=Streptomyces sp. SPB4 TaxID=2940553 RepID=UPI00247508E1|nr:hypothetical protein [Streptomyces sp. SPB4]MDH6544956.1 N12 class adenine-specific DNA methylase [Streptomyces sp. SPB4]
MGDEVATDTEAGAAPETAPAASPGPLPLPEGAQPVAAVTGYHALIKGGAVIVFGPDGTEIASARRASGYGSAIAGRVGDTRLVADGIGDGRLTTFAELAARHHRAVGDPGARDRVWVRWEEDGVAAVYGTDKYDDDDLRAVKTGNLYWSGQRQARATGRKWNPGTRDRNLAAVLKAFARQDRNIIVLGPGQTPEDLPTSLTPAAVAAAAAVPAQQAPPPAAPPAPEPAPEPEPEDLTVLSDEELLAAEEAAATARRSYRYSSDAPVTAGQYQHLEQEIGRRLVEREATAAPVTALSDEDLAAEHEWWKKTIGKTSFHSSDEKYRTLVRRRDAVTAEQNGRTARTLMAGPAAADLDDEALESAYERIGPVWTRLPGGTELNDQVTAYRKGLQEERVARRARSYGERTPVGEMTVEELIAESADLGSHLAARNEQSAYSYSEAVKDARAARLRVVDGEWDRRGLEQNPDAARAVMGDSSGGKRQVLIDGSERSCAYGYVERHGKKFRALAGWEERSSLGDFDSGPAAMAALVQRYDQDPQTRPRRTWGNTRKVDLPSSSYDPLVSWLRRRPSELSGEYDRVLGLLTPYQLPTQTKVINPLTNQVMRAYPFYFEEGLLGELARIAERTTEDLREQSLNEQLPKREREAAKRRIPAMGAALIGINAVIEQVRAAGGDVERRGVDQGRLAAQMAALDGTVDEREGGESDGGEQPVRDAAAAALGGVPAPGAGSDGGPGAVLPDAGDADGRGDRRGGGGPGGGAGAGDGVPGPGGADGADLGDGAGAGPARDAAAAGGSGGAGGAAESGSSGAGVDPQGAGEPVATRRFRPDPADLPRGPLARAEANLEAVKVLRTLERENRATTVDEARTLARWSGWGSVPTVFLEEPDPDEPIYGPGGDREGGFKTDHATWESYSRVRGELRDLLDPFEWRAASRAVLSAHYTPQAVAESMWQGLAAFGFDGGEVLEAGCGSGAFFGVAPPAARLTGVELDPTTAAIAGRIYPHANVLAESFTDTDVPLGTFDAVIGNVPFAQAPFGERRYRAGGHSLHNGFIIKQLALLRPGAYMTVITSRWTLDGEDTAARRDMSRWGDLAAAYRLPKGTFGETADTDVVADVLVFRRRAEGEEPRDEGWIEAPERELGGNAVTVNAYFTEHPEHVLGRLTTETGPYGPRVTVQGDPGQAPGLLRERMEATAAAAVADGLGYVHHEDWPHREPLLLQTARLKHATDFTGRLYTDDTGAIWQHLNGADPVRVITADGVSGTKQLRTLLALRDVAGELQELDRTGQDPDRARKVRDQLARLHASYTEKHGPLSRPRQTRLALPGEEAAAAARAAGVELDAEDRLPTGWGWFRQDPHAAVVLGLEHWDRANDRAVNSEVLTRRPGARRGDLEPTDDPKTALTAVMGATGRVDLPLIASLLGTTADEARARLGTEVFDNPVTKKLEHAGAYLSGAVREKLEQAREAAVTDPKYAVNVAALDVVQPPPKRLGQFTAQLGAHWIPAPLVQGFLRDYLGDPTLQVSHNERYGWSLATGKVPDAINALKGTERRSAVHIAKALLGRASMVVNLLDGSGVDEDATRAMRYKVDAMRSAFEEFCTASTQRVTQLTDAYNRQMNGHVVRSYDSLAPTLEGFTTERTPHPWQLSGAARMQFERGVILAHEMGLGKTTTMVMGSQALKASGQIAKPFAVVQPGLGRQWLDEAKLLYPNADIHLITSGDLADGNRRPVLEWLRANSPDLVIFTEGAFQSIRMSPEQQELYLFREIESLKEQLERERGVPHNAFALMKLEQRLATVESRIRRNDAPMRTPGEVYWDDLGFDYACIDEAHRFTAVGFRSKEAGGETASVRAVDLHQKLSWHHRMAEYDGGRPTVTLGTGTPMENSIFEQYSGLELATPWLLDQFGVHGPDLWSETFGQKVQRIEQAPDGSGLTIVERFSRFVSKSTMKTMWGLATDTKTGDEVGIERPQVSGGAPKLVLVEPTADQRTRLQSLVVRGQAIHAGDVTRDEDNMLAVSGEGRAVALDPRLVDAGAPAGNKLVEAADIIAAGYHAHKDHIYAVSSRDDTPHPVPGGLFFVFANSGTPGGNNKGGFDAYAELRDLLAARGVPPDMVQFAQEYRTPERKAEMTRAANNGGIAVLMGSSEVLGTGFNGQNRAYALMHLDQDWTPAMMMQRNARALRPGNQHEEVDIYFLATRGSMDAWQVGLLTSKAEGLRDIQRPPGVGDDDGDTVEEIGESDWDYATMAAEIGGNPHMRQFMEAKIHLQGLEADRRNAAADRVRQMELLGTKEGELAGTRRAIAARERALPKITETIRGDAFRIRIGGREFEKFGEAAPVLRQVVTEAVRAHQREGRGPWKKLGTFGGLDFAVQPEVADGSGEVRAYIGFPELRHSESRCSVEDLVKGNIGATMLGRLATALEKAEDHQLMDRERLPGLEKEVAVLTAQQEAVNYGPAIEHARRRVELLDGIVGAITERDKIPELTESMLDPKKHLTENSRKKALQENAEKRAPHQANVDAAAAQLAAFDAENPAPEPVVLVNTWTEDNDTAEAFEQWRERQGIIVQQNREAGLGAPIPGDVPAPAPEDGAGDTAAAEPTSSSEESTEGPALTPEPEGESTEEPAEQTTEPSSDEFGLARPDRVPAPAPQDEPESESEEDESAGVPEGQMTVEEVAAGPAPATVPQAPPPSPEGSSGEDAPGPEPDADPYGTADLFDEFGLTRPERVPAPDPQNDPAPEEPQEDADGVPDGQMTVDDAAPAAAPAADDRHERLTSADGQLTFTLNRVPTEDVRPETVEGYRRLRDELAAAVETRNAQSTQTREERDQELANWQRRYKAANGLELWRPTPSLRLTPHPDAPGLTPAEYALGSWVTWQDTATGAQVTGQVMAPGAAKDTWFVSTERTAVTGEYHVLSRGGKKPTGYSYSINGDTSGLQPAAGVPEPVPFESLPAVDAIPARPVPSYADYVPKPGMAMVREPVPVLVGPDEARAGEVVFPVTADGVPFVIRVDQHDASLTLLYSLRVEVDGETVAQTRWTVESRASAVEAAVHIARTSRESADKPLYARGRNHRLDVAEDGVCARCNRQFDGDSGEQQLYRVDGADPTCAVHIASSFEVSIQEVEELGTARRVWAARTAPAPQPDTVPTPTEEPPAPELAPDEPRLVDRDTVGPGDLVTITLDVPGVFDTNDREVPGAVRVTGTLNPAYRDYHSSGVLLDSVIHDAEGNEMATGADVTVRRLPSQIELTPAGHRADLRPESRTAGQLRLGDLIAEGGTRGEVVTEIRYANTTRGASVFSSRDAAKGTVNQFSLANNFEVLVVPRERRRPQDVADVFGRHHGDADVAAQTRQTDERHTALEQEAARLWPDGDGPQAELRALRQAVAAIDPEASGREAYRANAEATAAAAVAATALFDAVDDTIRYRGLGEPLHRLRQHLDVQVHRLNADVTHLEQRAQARAATDNAPAPEQEAPEPPTASDKEAPMATDTAPTDPDPGPGQETPDAKAPAPDASAEEQLGLFGETEPGPQPPANNGTPPDPDPSPPAPTQNDPAPARGLPLPALEVTLPQLDVPALGPAEPFADDTDVLAGIAQLHEAYERWAQLPDVQRYLDDDRERRSEALAPPTNPVGELHEAYARARGALEASNDITSPDMVLARLYAVAAWSRALEPAVGEELAAPLGELSTAAYGLAARSQATIAEFAQETQQPVAAGQGTAPSAEPALQPSAGKSTPRSLAAAGDADGTRPMVVEDEFSILYAAFQDLIVTTAEDGQSTRYLLGRSGVLAEPGTVQRLLDTGLLEHPEETATAITPAGRYRLAALAESGRGEPGVGDRVLLVSIGLVGVVGGYETTGQGVRRAEVVFDREGWPDGWDLAVQPLYLTTLEPAVMDAEEAAQRYRQAVLRQFAGTRTDPTLRDDARAAFVQAALASPELARAAREGHPDEFVPAVASWMSQWATQQWADVPEDEQPAWVPIFFRASDDAVSDRNGLYADVAGAIRSDLRLRPREDLEVESRRLAPRWVEYTIEGRTYRAALLPEELTRGRLATLSTAIVDERNELVGRSVGLPGDDEMRWVHTNPGVPSPSVMGWLRLGSDVMWPPYSAQERAHMQAGPPAEQMSFDLGAGPSEEALAEEEDEDLDDTTESGDGDDPEYEVSVPGEDTQTTAAPDPVDPHATDTEVDAEQQDTADVSGPALPVTVETPLLTRTAQLAKLPAPGNAPAAAPPALTAPPQDAPEDSEMATPTRSGEDAARTDSGTPVPPAQPAPDPAPEVSPAAQQDAADDFEFEDPPEPQRRTTFFDLPHYDGHRVYLSGWDGMDDDQGELRREGSVIATLQRTDGGQWYARMQLDSADVTRLVEHPQTAAEQGAVMYAAFTGAPLGPPVAPAPGSDIQARAEQVRSELRHFAAMHAPSIETAVRQLSPRYRENPHYAELAARLADVADSKDRGSRMMAADLAGVERAVHEWSTALPPSPSSEIRAALAFALAHMLFDVRQLQARLQATVEVAQAEQAAQQQKATAPAEEGAPAEPAEAPSPAINGEPAPNRPEPAAEAAEPMPQPAAAAADTVTPTDQPTSASTVPGEAEMTTPTDPTLDSSAGDGKQFNPGEAVNYWYPASGRGQRWRGTVVGTNDDGVVVDGVNGLQTLPSAQVDPIPDALRAPDQQSVQSPALEQVPSPRQGDAESLMAEGVTPRGGLSETAVPVPGEPDKEGKDVPAGAEVRQTDHVGAGTALPTGDLPLWKTDELPLWKGRPAGDAAEAPVVLSAESQQDLDAAFGSVMEAYAEIVPEDQGTAKDLYDDVQDDLRTLQQLLGAATRLATSKAEGSTQPPAPGAVPSRPAPAEQAEESHVRGPGDPERNAEEVNRALQQAGTHTPQLRDLPEWQQIQTIGGAFRHLCQVVKTRAGIHSERLEGDERVDGFFRTLSARVCQKVADLAQSAANRLRRGKTDTQGPAEEALLRLGDAARTYSSPDTGSRGTSRPGEKVDVPTLRKMGEALAKPMPGARSKVSAAAARSRSVTAKRPVKKPAPSSTESTHLRRGGPDQPQPKRPTR